MYVNTFFVRLFFFWPKMVYHRAFLYRSVLCICIYKQIYTNICRLQCVFCERFITTPSSKSLNIKQSFFFLFINKVTIQFKKKQIKESKQKHLPLQEVCLIGRLSDVIRCYRMDSTRALECGHCSFFCFCGIKLLAARAADVL